jgi:hypothetical protein
MTNIVSNIFEARIRSLIKKRDKAIRNKDYELAGRLNRKIDNNINRRIKWC